MISTRVLPAVCPAGAAAAAPRPLASSGRVAPVLCGFCVVLVEREAAARLLFFVFQA